MSGRRTPTGSSRRTSPATTLRVQVTGKAPAAWPQLRKAARAALQAEGRASARLEIAVVNDTAMRAQHRHWMGKDTTTDVLTFDLSAGETATAIDGQILVCVDVARREAMRRKTDWRDELTLYVVHGCLHLCGYDDRRQRDFRRMHRREDEILSGMGLGPMFSADGSKGAGEVRRTPKPPAGKK